MRVGVAGDWHGSTKHAIKSIRTFKRLGVDTIYHLGDFGFGWSKAYEEQVNEVLSELDIVLFVIPGNHENYDFLDTVWYDPIITGVRRVKSHLKFFDRGARWKIGETTFVALGGAASVDRKYRKPNVSWWEQEYITPEDVQRTKAGGKADVMLCHDLTWGVHIPLGPESDWPPEDIERSNINRKLVRLAADVVQPKLFMHGHYHKFNDETTELFASEASDETYTTRHVGLDMEGTAMNLAILDTDTLELEFIDYWTGLETSWEN